MAKKAGENHTKGSRYLFMLFFLVLLVLAFLVIKPFITIILTSAVIAYILYPLYKRLKAKTRMPVLSAVICILIALVVIAIPLFFIASQVVDEGYSVYLQFKESVDNGESVFLECETKTNIVCSAIEGIRGVETKYGLDLGIYFSQALEAIAAKAISFATGIILGLPTVLFRLFVMIFLLFFMIIDGPKALKYMRQLLPLTRPQQKHVTQTFNDLIHATLYGAVLVSIVQGVLAGIGFLIFGVSSPFLWGMLTVIAAFIPFIGTAIVWVPIVLKMLVEGFVLSNNILLWKTLGLALYCILIVSSIDNLLKPKIVGDRARLHPVIILLGVFGGLAMFGIAGIIIGPLLLALFIAMLKIYEIEKEQLH